MGSLDKKFKFKRYDNKIRFTIWRFIILYGCVLIALSSLLSRIAWLQIINPKQLVKENNLRSVRVQIIPVTRGMISDRVGRPLAVSIPVNAIWIDPQRVNKQESFLLNRQLKELSNALSIPLNQLTKRINMHRKEHFVYLARQVNATISNYIKGLKLPYIYLRQELRRYYPEGPITSNLIGFTNIDGNGIEGIEKSFDKWLTGYPGKRTVRKDLYGHIIENISIVDRSISHNLTLSIDERLQALVYRKLNNAVMLNKAESGTAVIVDINTGEVLVMANSPAYNPNNMNDISKSIVRNRAITDMFEPGSTVKPMVVMTALKLGLVKENSVLNTASYHVNGYEIKDVTYYNKLSITGILQKSSNVGVSRLALSMPFSALVDTYSRFGIGKSTNLGLIGESSGLYPQKKSWSDIERATFSFGYGLMVTPLQLARVYATIGSYGINRPLSITKVNSLVVGKRVFPEYLVKKVLHMMESVALPGGSGIKASIKGYRIAIKTGTAKKVGPHGYYVNKYIAYTAGIAPASRPCFSLVVLINEPKAGKYYGGAVSAPVFGAIMECALRTMNISPDVLSNRKINF